MDPKMDGDTHRNAFGGRHTYKRGSPRRAIVVPIPQIMEELVRQRIVEQSVPSCYWFKVIQFFVSCHFPGETLLHACFTGDGVRCKFQAGGATAQFSSVAEASSSSGWDLLKVDGVNRVFGPRMEARSRMLRWLEVGTVGDGSSRTLHSVGCRRRSRLAQERPLKAQLAHTDTLMERSRLADPESESRTGSRDGVSQFGIAETGTVARDRQSQFSLRNQRCPILATNCEWPRPLNYTWHQSSCRRISGSWGANKVGFDEFDFERCIPHEDEAVATFCVDERAV